MAKFSATIVALAVVAVYLSVEVLSQAPGDFCDSRADCDASACSPSQSICCAGYNAALAGGRVYSFGSGRCTCCNTPCSAQLGHANSTTPNTNSHADAYHQGCSNA